MVNYDTIPEEAQVQPAAKTAWRRVVVVAAAASFVLGAFALRTATPTVALDAEVKLGPVYSSAAEARPASPRPRAD